MQVKTEEELLDEVVDLVGLEQLMLDADLTHLDVALHLHNCGLLDLTSYFDEMINTRTY